MACTASLGMPGGSWLPEEQELINSLPPGMPVSGADVFTPGEAPTESNSPISQNIGPQTVHSEILMLSNPAKLEEIVLLDLPATSVSRETWRVRISPDYDIEMLPPNQPQDIGISRPPLRDSPQQRRSRNLDTIFPELRDDFRSSSRSVADGDFLLSVLDLEEWDFSEYDPMAERDDRAVMNTSEDNSSVPEDSRQDRETSLALKFGLAFSALPVNGVGHDTAIDINQSAPRTPSTLITKQSKHDDIGATALFSSSIPETGTSSPSPPSTARSSISTDDGDASAVEGVIRESDEVESTPRTPPALPSALIMQQSNFDDIATTPFSSSSPETTSSPGTPSTAHPSMSPSRSSLPTDDVPSVQGVGHEAIDGTDPAPKALPDVFPQQFNTDTTTPFLPSSGPVMGISSPSAPSTARSLFMSTLQPEDDVALSSDSDYHSQHSEETVDDPLLTPSSLVGASELGDQYDSESLPSTVIRPATTSAISQGDDDGEGQDPDGLEYLDEPPVLTPLTFQGLDDISLLISLDSFGVPDDWEFVPRPPEINGAAATFEFEPGDPPAAADEEAPSHSPIQSSSAALDGRSVEESFIESSQAIGPIVPEDSVDDVAVDVESTEGDVDETETDLRKTGGGAEASAEESGGVHQSDEAENDWTPELTTLHFPSGSVPDETDRGGEEAEAEHQYLDDGQAENEWTPVLPALHFHSPSLSDEVLGSPEFNAAVFAQDEDGVIPAAPPRAVPRSRHLRALSTSNVERTSILWAPMETKYGTETARSASAKGKGKARPRARTVSGFAGTDDRRRVEREVQTAAAKVDDRHALRAKYTRLKSELRSERVRVAGLMRDGEAGRWEAKPVRVFNYISGGFTSDLEDVIQVVR